MKIVLVYYRCVGGDVIFISENGIKTKEDVIRLKENNVDAF
ncbi:hypothetical protein [Methanobrevibacter sp. V74]|nr:hypothetical protein [Methanobrevibacter sp. V74]